jgi:hypothetical protein
LPVTRFVVLAIWSMSIDEIKNTQKNGSRGKGIVANPQRDITKKFVLTLFIENSLLRRSCKTCLTTHR